MPAVQTRLLGLALLAGLLASGAALAQQPSSGQLSALRQNCRTDFRSFCTGVTPGGRPALNCLQENMTSLSPACQQAVEAVGPAPNAPPQGAPPPVNMQVGPAPSPPPGGYPQPGPPQQVPPPQPGLPPQPGPPPLQVPPAGKPLPYVSAPTEPAQQPPARMPIARACGGDFREFCRGVRPGNGTILACLRENAASLSAQCQQALSTLRR